MKLDAQSLTEPLRLRWEEVLLFEQLQCLFIFKGGCLPLVTTGKDKGFFISLYHFTAPALLTTVEDIKTQLLFPES